MKVSGAVYSNPATAPTNQHQDALGWVNAGALDIAVPMMYFSGGAGTTWDTRLQTWIAGVGERHVVAGHSTSQGVASLLEQIDLSRTRGAQGNSVFSWSSFSYWSDYTAGPYAGAAGVPAMPWKTSPTTAVVYGYVSDSGGLPVVDAQVTRTGSTYTALSSGDGFYAFLLVPDGTYTLTASHPGYSPGSGPVVSVVAGDVVRRDITLGAPLPPVIAEVSPDPDTVVAGEQYILQLQLAQGVASSWSVISGPPTASADNGLVCGWTPTVGEVGQDDLIHGGGVERIRQRPGDLGRDGSAAAAVFASHAERLRGLLTWRTRALQSPAL